MCFYAASCSDIFAFPQDVPFGSASASVAIALKTRRTGRLCALLLTPRIPTERIKSRHFSAAVLAAPRWVSIPNRVLRATFPLCRLEIAVEISQRSVLLMSTSRPVTALQ